MVANFYLFSLFLFCFSFVVIPLSPPLFSSSVHLCLLLCFYLDSFLSYRCFWLFGALKMPNSL